MPNLSRRQLMQLAALAIAVLVLTSGSASLVAETRQVSIETLIYDLKSPDAVRRQAAARELGNARHRPAIPQLAALANDPVAAVRREVELTLERMEDIQTLPGFIAFASDNEDDIRSRAVAALVKLHLPRAIGVAAALTTLRERIVYRPDRDLDVVVEPDVPVDPAVVSTLRVRIDDSERGIRRTAIRGLGILRAKPAVPDLLRIVREDRDGGLRFEAVRALRKIADGSSMGRSCWMSERGDDDVRATLGAHLGG